MNDGQNAKQQIVERIKTTNNILVTVSTNPSVDELSAALGLTIMLNGMNKHATAVVSGDIPPAITFLEPDKTFENTVDSLRDFIIALDKEKADHLRYKVDGDVVKIFITPYRTTISSDDLDFSQGDYNVELVLALGVRDKDNLDNALTAHGRILHDATVATLSCDESPSELGSIDWFEPNASSLSEMLVSLSEAIKGEKAILDEQSATALLTGIVAATDRFSNNRTSSRVMTMAAQLMAAGANQQLIAAKLEEAHEIGPDKEEGSDDDSSENNDGTTDLEEGEATKVEKKSKGKKNAKKEDANDGALQVSHEKEGDVDEVAEQTAEENQADAADEAQDSLAEQLQGVAPTGAKPSIEDLKKDLASAEADLDEAAGPKEEESVLPPVKTDSETPAGGQPSMGGTLNATTEQAQKDNEQAEKDDRNKTILSHNNGDYVGDSAPSFQAPFNAVGTNPPEPSSVDIFKDTKPAINLDQPDERSSDSPSVKPAETLEDIDKKNRSDAHNDAQAAVAAAFDNAPFNPANQPSVGSGAQPLGSSLHYEETPLPSIAQPAPVVPPAMPPVTPPPAPSLPDFSVLPPPPPPPVNPTPQAPAIQPQGPLPPDQLGQIFGTPPAESTPPAQPAPNDPNQFKIPGQ